MTTEIINGVCSKIRENFGADCQVYKNSTEKGVIRPCFFVNHKETKIAPELPGRSLCRISVEILYTPRRPKRENPPSGAEITQNEASGEMSSTAEILAAALIMVNCGEIGLIRCENFEFTIGDKILKATAKFVFRAKYAESWAPEAEKMQKLALERNHA